MKQKRGKKFSAEEKNSEEGPNGAEKENGKMRENAYARNDASGPQFLVLFLITIQKCFIKCYNYIYIN